MGNGLSARSKYLPGGCSRALGTFLGSFENLLEQDVLFGLVLAFGFGVWAREKTNSVVDWAMPHGI
jgi:hypothetical protein